MCLSLPLRMSSQSLHSQNQPTVWGGRDREPEVEETFYLLPASSVAGGSILPSLVVARDHTGSRGGGKSKSSSGTDRTGGGSLGDLANPRGFVYPASGHRS